MADVEKLLKEYGPQGDAQLCLQNARELYNKGRLQEAASFIERAYCIDPLSRETTILRKDILDKLSVTDCGIEFRYIPAGTFLMGSDKGEPDEYPVHPVYLPAYWISAVPISWEAVCNILGIGVPPQIDFDLLPKDGYWNDVGFSFRFKIILQYCEDETTRARDWHSHDPFLEQNAKLSSIFKKPARNNMDATYTYRNKPVVALDWNGCSKVCEKMSGRGSHTYALPTEAEWEKAARGGLHGCQYAWGDDSPQGKADFGRFQEFSILPSRTYPPNGYGLYAICGGVSEWTQDWYDAKYYSESPSDNPAGPIDGRAKVLRGGSWSDCPEACTVSFRTAVPIKRVEQRFIGATSPTIGFRICRKAPAG